MSDIVAQSPRIVVPRTETTARQLIADIASARAELAAVRDRYDIPRLFADSCVCGEPTAPGLVWCSPCAARVERLHSLARSTTCLSCGDPCVAVLCAACAESGEVAL